MSDVLLYQTNDNGEINVEGGVVEMSGGLETAVYLSLFGGNVEDDGRAESPLSWWGNLNETPEKHLRSDTQYVLRSLPAIPANLRRVEDAVRKDLAWLVELGAATGVDARATMPGVNRVQLTVVIRHIGDPTTLEFVENWRADA